MITAGFTERFVIPGLSDDEDRVLHMLMRQLEARQPGNLRRASFYDGKHAVRQVGTIIPPQYYRLGIVLGWSAKAVDILARRCNFDSMVWPDGELDSLGYPQMAERNLLSAEISSAIVSSLIHGVSFLIVTQGAADEPPALLHVKDALNATGLWNPRRRSLDAALSVLGRNDEGRITEFVLYLPGLTITAVRDGVVWRSDRSQHPWGVPVEPMVYRPRAGRPFGSSRISRPVMSLQEQALRTVIRMEAHNDVYTIPDLWLFGADESIFKNADGSQKASWDVRMGRFKALSDPKSAVDGKAVRPEVTQLPASSPQPHIDSLRQQAQLFSGETSIPLTSLGVSDMSNPTSADSYIASREDLIAEAEGATDDWGPPVRRSIVRALAIQNGLDAVPAEWFSVAPKWRSPVYLSRAAAADAGVKQLSAVPWLADTEVGLELLGLNEQQIERALAERRRVAGRGVLAALRDQAAAAASALP